MKRKLYSHALILLLALCFAGAQILPVAKVYAQERCPAMSKGQKISQMKQSCCCCKTNACSCDLKKGKTSLPKNHDLAFPTNMSYQSFEEISFLQEHEKKPCLDNRTSAMFWALARAPCPIIYLTTSNFLC